MYSTYTIVIISFLSSSIAALPSLPAYAYADLAARSPLPDTSSSSESPSPPSIKPLITFSFDPAGSASAAEDVEQKLVHLPDGSHTVTIDAGSTTGLEPRSTIKRAEEKSSDLHQTRKRDFAILTPSIWNELMAKAQAADSGSKFSLGLSGKASSSNGAFATSDTQNGLATGQPCAPMTVIFARGTLERGNVGSITGPPFFAALAATLGSENHLKVQGVEYPADVAGFLAGGSAAGSSVMAGLVTQAISQCPGTKIVLSGYNQGAQLVHNAASQLSPAILAQISSIVLFGDPSNGTALTSQNTQFPNERILTLCHQGDVICNGGNQALPQHLNYAVDAGKAASFVAMLSGLGMGVSMEQNSAVGIGSSIF